MCKIRTGKTYKSFIGKEGVPVLKTSNIKDGRVSDDNLLYCDIADCRGAYTVKYGNIVMVRKGSAGSIGINLVDREFLFNEDLFKFSVNDEIVCERYLYHFLLSHQEVIKGLSEGSVIPGIRKSDVEELKVPIPTLEVQKKIAATLDKFREISLRDKQYQYYRNYLITGSKA